MRLTTVLMTGVAVLIAAPAAGASQAVSDGNVVTYSAAPGEHNSVLVSVALLDVSCGPVAVPCLTITDQVPIAAGGDCAVVGGNAACPLPSRVVANLGDRDDAYWDWNGDSTVHGGDGNDNPIEGNAGNDVLFGDGNSDQLIGDEGDDTLDGGPGDDYLEGVPGGSPAEEYTYGRDRYVGGGGNDSLTFEGRTDDLVLTADGVADDGAAGEGDDIAPDVTTIHGGHGSDRISGGAGRTVLFGTDGDDELIGGANDDRLVGGPGNDRLSGADGQDILGGDDGDDTISGGAGVDRFFGDAIGACIPSTCATGQDRIDARDGAAEVVNCGPGSDAVTSDTSDTLLVNAYISDHCEAVDAVGPAPGGGAAPGGGGSAPGGGGGTPHFALAAPARVTRGAIVLRIAAPGPGRLSLVGTAGRLRVGKVARNVSAAREVTLKLKPSAAARRALKKKGKLRVSLKATFRPAGSDAAVTLPARVTLRRAR